MMRLLRRFYSWVTWQRVAAGEMEIKKPKQETAVTLTYTILYVGAAWLFGTLALRYPLPLPGTTGFTNDAWYAFGFKIGLLLIVPGLWFFGQGYRVRDLLPGWRPRFTSILWIVIALGLGFCVNLGTLSLIVDKARRFSTGEQIVRIGTGILLPLFVAAIPEELVYRGLLQTRLERTLGRIAAILLTALLFAAWHLPSRFLLAQGIEGSAGDLGSVLIGTGIPVLIVGAIFCLLWDRHRSLLPLIALHWGIDILPSVALMLGIQR